MTTPCRSRAAQTAGAYLAVMLVTEHQIIMVASSGSTRIKPRGPAERSTGTSSSSLADLDGDRLPRSSRRNLHRDTLSNIGLGNDTGNSHVSTGFAVKVSTTVTRLEFRLFPAMAHPVGQRKRPAAPRALNQGRCSLANLIGQHSECAHPAIHGASGRIPEAGSITRETIRGRDSKTRRPPLATVRREIAVFTPIDLAIILKNIGPPKLPRLMDRHGLAGSCHTAP